MKQILPLLVLISLVSFGYCDRAFQLQLNQTTNQLGLARNGHLIRLKRQSPSLWQCPESTASTRQSRSLAFLAFYSPKKRQDINIYQARTKWKDLDTDRLLENGFDLNKPTLIYTHGYTQTIQREWLKNLRRNADEVYTNNQDLPFNLLFFDWSDYGQRAYGTSVSYVPYLGTLLSQFIQDQLFDRYKYSASNIHIISYSLSTHISGQTGRKLKAKGNALGQITAVDPTGVCFHNDAKFADKYQLRPSDAKLVVAKHYNMGGLGSRRAIGGVDIFVNGGSNQPAMSARGQFSVMSIVGAFGGASDHMRASQHESEPFDRTCQEVAYKCSSYEDFLAGQCGSCGNDGSKCYHISTLGNIELGLDPKNINYKVGTKMYLATGRSKFCLHTYQVVARLTKKASKADKRALEAGEFVVILGETSGDGQVQVNPRNRLNSDQYTQLLVLNEPLGEFSDRIKVSPTGGGSAGGSNLNLNSLQRIEINYLSNISPSERRKNSVRYCPKGNDMLSKC